ncbi:Ribokinase-like protein [Thamnocephalis sphaerospora]|uniref:Adenosine kinase n=1 Tax=Thamnocephalis sphaerospora TaxID=78915 RepID=A0A4P9XSA9_9FUNG|nr:Ribokinase-like protein [Thamnocephalis sphaerospora]|eukprot:RKP09007.1 Ribokinase-like protein [Thamnocephalis sphaerospora]
MSANTATTTVAVDYEGVLFGLGNPLLDMCSKVELSFLEKYELKANDAILAGEKHADIYKELADNHEVVYLAGGSCQNSLRGAQRLLPPGSTFYVGCVGKDTDAEKLREAAAKDGLTVDYLLDHETPTGVCAMMINGPHRSLVTDLRAANKYQVLHLDQPEIKTAVERAQYFYIEGFFLTVSPDSILALAKHAAAENKVFSMNISAPFLCQFFREPMDASAPYWDFVFGNETEAAAWAESQGHKTQDLREIALLLANLPKINNQRKRYAVITQGAGHTLVATQGQISVAEVQSFAVDAIPKEEMEDTNGAGDAFVGGFLSQHLQGHSIDRSVNAGHYLAGRVIRQVSAQYPADIDLSHLDA